jgi:opacity protein-like surface antigen
MKKTIVAFALALSTVTAAASDAPSVPSRSNPIAPTASAVSAPKFWVGVNAGGLVNNGINGIQDAPWNVGVTGGYNFFKLGPIGLAVEGTYDYKKGDTQDVAGNVVGSVAFGSLAPYALAGVGYRWADIKNEKIWNVGGGVKYSFARNIEIDARYRRVEDWDRTKHDDRVTFGVNYKF